MNVTLTLRFDFERVENIVGIREIAGYQYFLLFLQCLHKSFSSSSSQLTLSQTSPGFYGSAVQVF